MPQLINFINTLLNNRENIMEMLSDGCTACKEAYHVENSDSNHYIDCKGECYSYKDIKEIFRKINLESNPEIKINSKNKILYNLLTGTYDASKYDKSAIDWIPSEELVDAIISIANTFNIKTIEEIYTGMGLLASLVQKKDPLMKVTAIDTFESIRTCNKLNLIPIAKRSAYDYKYYPLLGEEYPRMIISTYYPDNNIISDCTLKFVNEICDLIKSNNHDIIMIILPRTFTVLHKSLHYLSREQCYNLSTHHIKALDKFFFIREMFNEYHGNFMTAHILIKNNLLSNSDKNIALTPEEQVIPGTSQPSITDLMQTALVDSPFEYKCCKFEKLLEIFYEKVSPKLVKYIFKTYDFSKPMCLNDKLLEFKKYYFKLVDNNIYLCQYAYDIDEFIFWASCALNDLYFVFDNRIQFYAFYTQVVSIEMSEIRRNINFPLWIQTPTQIKIYIYLETVYKNSGWKNNHTLFNITFNDINAKNKSLICKK